MPKKIFKKTLRRKNIIPWWVGASPKFSKDTNIRGGEADELELTMGQPKKAAQGTYYTKKNT